MFSADNPVVVCSPCYRARIVRYRAMKEPRSALFLTRNKVNHRLRFLCSVKQIVSGLLDFTLSHIPTACNILLSTELTVQHGVNAAE